MVPNIYEHARVSAIKLSANTRKNFCNSKVQIESQVRENFHTVRQRNFFLSKTLQLGNFLLDNRSRLLLLRFFEQDQILLNIPYYSTTIAINALKVLFSFAAKKSYFLWKLFNSAKHEHGKIAEIIPDYSVYFAFKNMFLASSWQIYQENAASCLPFNSASQKAVTAGLETSENSRLLFKPKNGRPF